MVARPHTTSVLSFQVANTVLVCLQSFCHSNARCMIDRFAHHEAKYSGILAYLTRSMEKHKLSQYSICTLLDDTDRVAPTMGCAVFVHIGVFSMIMN